jgi:hypothetical protein
MTHERKGVGLLALLHPVRIEGALHLPAALRYFRVFPVESLTIPKNGGAVWMRTCPQTTLSAL